MVKCLSISTWATKKVSEKSKYYWTNLEVSSDHTEIIKLVFKCFDFEIYRTLHSNSFPFVLSQFFFFASKVGYYVLLLCLCVVSSEWIFSSTIKRENLYSELVLQFFLVLSFPQKNIIILCLATVYISWCIFQPSSWFMFRLSSWK